MDTDFDDFQYDDSLADDHNPWADDITADGLTYLLGRRPDRSYVSRTFDAQGEPARLVHRVLDSDEWTDVEYDGQVWLLRTSPGGRSQVKMLIRGQEHKVAEINFVRVYNTNAGPKTKDCISLNGEHAEQLIELIRSLDYIPIEGAKTVRVDGDLVRALFTDPTTLTDLYRKDPERFRRLISDDSAAQDVVAVAHRREQVERFRLLLNDDAYFDAQIPLTPHGRPEDVWQEFFETNPWILGVTLAGQIFTSWSNEKLEQVVAGCSISGVGKRTDALLRTVGAIRSLVFAELKTHKTPLLKPYRSGCYGPSTDLSGGIAQVQGTVYRAVRAIGEQLDSFASDGSEIPGDHSYLVHPRSFLIIGRLSDLRGEAGGMHRDQYRSFELFRRNIAEPEIVTYDELLCRAEWHVDTAAGQVA